ncbi:unnamed protein product [Withania somnifera]
MDRKTGKGKQKIEMKLIESKEARTVSFSKRKKGLFKKAEEYSTITGADIGVMLISPSGRPYSYGSTSIENITNKFLELKQGNCQRNHADLGESNAFEAFEDDTILEIPPDKQRLEQLVLIKSRLDNIKKERKGELATPENA